MDTAVIDGLDPDREFVIQILQAAGAVSFDLKSALDSNGGFGPNMYTIPGHGISTVVHSGPLIYPGYNGALRQNVAIALEPDILVDNAFRIQIEDDFLITATGAERITTAPGTIEAMIISPP